MFTQSDLPQITWAWSQEVLFIEQRKWRNRKVLKQEIFLFGHIKSYICW